eukprot:scaffold5726_cov72-Phaeocystis_antarctica.AAC.2
MSDEKSGSMLMVPEMTIDEHWASVNRPFLIAEGTAAEGQACWILTQNGLVAKVERHRAQRGVDSDGINSAARRGHLTLGERGVHSGSSLSSSLSSISGLPPGRQVVFSGVARGCACTR